MHKRILLWFRLLILFPALAQRTTYQDEIIGWQVMFATDSTTKPTVCDNRVISAKQSRTAGVFRQ